MEMVLGISDCSLRRMGTSMPDVIVGLAETSLHYLMDYESILGIAPNVATCQVALVPTKIDLVDPNGVVRRKCNEPGCQDYIVGLAILN